ncbi:hypothetical protein [Achromobacter xylosoxidans]|uniref:hypothetical protein n=1 Tax=Alcaligenes xylosoxydans xylosoxydans TaxID=85698 RepID=UPI0006BFDC64|nr:hypothetical protein [Achromobacter xylosoxidans]CUI26077.1 Uncharacterised protein [Achromobacter xylosoxidans]
MAELDDVAEKARRNLMVVATGIITVAALGIPLDGRLVGAVNLNEVEPWRAWACTGTVLFYFWLRFHLAPSRSEARSHHKEKKAQELESRFKAFANDQFSRWTTKGARSLKVTLAGPYDPQSIGTSLVNVQWNPRFSGGTAHMMQYRIEDLGVNYDRPIGMGKLRFRVTPAARLWVWASVHITRLRHLTWEGLELSLPHVLSGAAAAVCIWKFCSALYYSFPFMRHLLPA